jgi:hypothetical protein
VCSEKRIEQHLAFFVNNLEYPHASGRVVVLRLLTALLFKLPRPMLLERARMFFLPLVLRFANETDVDCRAAAAQVHLAFAAAAARASRGR